MICILTSNIAQIPPLKGLQIWSCHLHLGQMNQVTGGSTAQKTSEKVSPGSNQKTPRIFPRKLPNSFPAVGSHPISWGCRPIQRSSPLLFLICTGCPACTNPQKWQDAGGWKPFLLWLRRLFVEPIPLGYIHYMCIYKCIEIYTCTYIYTLIYILYIYIHVNVRIFYIRQQRPRRPASLHQDSSLQSLRSAQSSKTSDPLVNRERKLHLVFQRPPQKVF